MEDNNHIDELFRTGLNQNFPVDDNLWAQVESQLPSQGGRRGLWVFNLNSLALLAILSISMVLKSDTVETARVSNEAIIASKETPIAVAEKAINNQTELVANIPERALKIDQVLESNERTTKALLNETKTNLKIRSKQEKEKTTDSKQKLVPNRILPFKNSLEPTIESEEVDIPIANFESLVFIEGGQYLTLKNSINRQPIDKKNFWSATRKPYYYYELEANRSLALNKNISGLPEEIEAYKSKRETGGTNANFGLNLLSDYKYFQLGIGIRYSRFTEGIQYVVDAPGVGYDISFDTTYSIVNGSFNSNGEPVLLIKREIERIETAKGITIKQNVLFRNEFERLQVPLLIGVHKNYGRFYGNLRASVLINYSIQQTGAYIGNDLNQINNFEASKQINQFTIGTGYAASLGYSINEFVVLGTRFNYETDLTSYTKDYSSRFSQYGVGVWMMWKPR